MNNKESLENDVKISAAVPDDSEGIINVLHKTWLATYPNQELGITVEDIEDSYKDMFTPIGIQKRKERIANPPPNQ